MPNSFLAAARQGKTGLWRYFATIFLWLTFTVGAVLIFSVGMDLIGIDYGLQQTILDKWRMQAFGVSILGFIVFSLITLCFWLAFYLIHQRPFRTLIRAEKPIRWAQIGKGALLGLCLNAISMGALLLLDPDRYQFNFIFKEWLLFLIPWLIASLIVSLLFGVLHGYFLQGFSLLLPIHKPHQIAILFAAAVKIFANLGRPADILSLITSILRFYFDTLIVIQNQGIELLLGLFLSDNVFDLFMSSPAIVDLSGTLLFFPAVFQSTESTRSLLEAVISCILSALFYGIYFGVSWRKRVNL